MRAVVFDVGETLLDESRAWSEWARWLGVSELTLAAVLGATIAAGRDHVEALRAVKPGFDLTVERRARAAAGFPDELRAGDLYPDALPCIAARASSDSWWAPPGTPASRWSAACGTGAGSTW